VVQIKAIEKDDAHPLRGWGWRIPDEEEADTAGGTEIVKRLENLRPEPL